MTAKPLAVLRYICGHQAAHGFSPSYSEIAVGIGLTAKSKSTVSILIKELEFWSVLDGVGPYNRSARARAIEVLRPVPVPRAPDGAALYAVPIALYAGKV